MYLLISLQVQSNLKVQSKRPKWLMFLSKNKNLNQSMMFREKVLM